MYTEEEINNVKTVVHKTLLLILVIIYVRIVVLVMDMF